MDWHIDQSSHWYFYGSDMCYSSRIDRDQRYKMIWRSYNWIIFPKGRKKSTHELLACCRFPKIQRLNFITKMQYDKDIWGDILAAQVGAQNSELQLREVQWHSICALRACRTFQCQVLLWSQHCGVFSFRCPLWRCWLASYLGLLWDFFLLP